MDSSTASPGVEPAVPETAAEAVLADSTAAASPAETLEDFSSSDLSEEELTSFLQAMANAEALSPTLIDSSITPLEAEAAAETIAAAALAYNTVPELPAGTSEGFSSSDLSEEELTTFLQAMANAETLSPRPLDSSIAASEAAGEATVQAALADSTVADSPALAFEEEAFAEDIAAGTAAESAATTFEEAVAEDIAASTAADVSSQPSVQPELQTASLASDSQPPPVSSQTQRPELTASGTDAASSLAHSSDTQHSELTVSNTEPVSPLTYSSDTQHSDLVSSTSQQEDVFSDSAASDNSGLQQPVPSAVPAAAMASDPTLPAMRVPSTPSEVGQIDTRQALAPPPVLQQEIEADLADLQALRLQVRETCFSAGLGLDLTLRPDSDKTVSTCERVMTGAKLCQNSTPSDLYCGQVAEKQAAFNYTELGSTNACSAQNTSHSNLCNCQENVLKANIIEFMSSSKWFTVLHTGS